MFEELNNDVLKEVMTFLDTNQYQILSEINKFFHHFMSFYTIHIPSKKYLLSSIDCFEWAVNHGFTQKNIYKTIIRQSDNPIELLNHVYTNETQKLLTSNVLFTALKTKNYQILSWLKSHYCSYSVKLFSIYYRLDMEHIDWVKNELIWTPYQLEELFKAKNIKAIKWACMNYAQLREFLFLYAIEFEQMDLIKWGIAKKFKLESEVMATAVKKGNINICKMLLRYKCEVDEESLYYAVESNNFEMVKWCIKNYFPSNAYACAEAASNNNLDMLKYLRKHNVDWDVNTFIEAKRHPLIFRYVVENGCPQR